VLQTGETIKGKKQQLQPEFLYLYVPNSS